MICGGCGYENPIDLARCPRCGLSEATIMKRAAEAAVDPDVGPVPEGDNPEIATMVQLTLEREKPAAPPVIDPEPRTGSRHSVEAQLRAARKPSPGRMLAGLGGWAAAFLAGAVLGIALSSSASPSQEPRVAAFSTRVDAGVSRGTPATP